MAETQVQNGAGAMLGDAMIRSMARAVFVEIKNLITHDCGLLDIEGAARYLSMSPAALRHKTDAGDLPVVRLDSRLRFDRRDLDRLIDGAQRKAA
jgi:hypothetical protein